MNEIWKNINNFNGIYLISNFGRIKKVITEHNCRYGIRFMTGYINKKGYHKVTLMKSGKRHQFYVHRLVAEHFLENKSNKKEVNHIDFNKTNNNIKNLEWCSSYENQLHNLKHGKKCGFLKKSVKRFSLDGKYIDSFESISTASVCSGADISNISNCLMGKRKSSGGYIWRINTGDKL
jgi:hypothetical protein